MGPAEHPCAPHPLRVQQQLLQGLHYYVYIENHFLNTDTALTEMNITIEFQVGCNDNPVSR